MKENEAFKLMRQEKYRELYARAFNPSWAKGLDTIPEHMIPGLVRWAVFAVIPGGFLRAIIDGDLFAAAGRADSINASRLTEWARFMYNYIPAEAKGPGALSSWKGVKFEEEDKQ